MGQAGDNVGGWIKGRRTIEKLFLEMGAETMPNLGLPKWRRPLTACQDVKRMPGCSLGDIYPVSPLDPPGAVLQVDPTVHKGTSVFKRPPPFSVAWEIGFPPIDDLTTGGGIGRQRKEICKPAHGTPLLCIVRSSTASDTTGLRNDAFSYLAPQDPRSAAATAFVRKHRTTEVSDREGGKRRPPNQRMASHAACQWRADRLRPPGSTRPSPIDPWVEPAWRR